jgi:hypothetical protein
MHPALGQVDQMGVFGAKFSAAHLALLNLAPRTARELAQTLESVWRFANLIHLHGDQPANRS